MQKEIKWIENLLNVFIHADTPFHQVDFTVDNLDTVKLLTAIKTHKLLPIVYHVLKARPISHTFYESLKRANKRQLHKRYYQLGQLQRTITAFSEQGLTITPYKGVSLAKTFYNNINLRTSQDIDFAIAQEDIPASLSLIHI